MWIFLYFFSMYGLVLAQGWHGGLKWGGAKRHAAYAFAWLSYTVLVTVIFAGPIVIWHFGILRNSFFPFGVSWWATFFSMRASTSYYISTPQNVDRVLW